MSKKAKKNLENYYWKVCSFSIYALFMKRLRETLNWNIACPYHMYEIGVAWPFSKKGCFASTPDTFFVAHLQKLGRGTKMGNGTEWQDHYGYFCLKTKNLHKSYVLYTVLKIFFVFVAFKWCINCFRILLGKYSKFLKCFSKNLAV